MRSLIILNDIRPTPFLTAILLRKKLPMASIVADKSIIYNDEYGNKAGYLWGFFVQLYLMLITRSRLLKTIKLNNLLSIHEKKGLQSSLYSITCDTSANAEKYPEIYSALESLDYGAQTIVDYISTQRKDDLIIYIFNGRTASSYPIVRYCFEHRIRVVYYEYAAHCNGFRLYPVPPHASAVLGEYLLIYYKKGNYSPWKCTQAAWQFEQDKLSSNFSKNNKEKPTKQYDVVMFLGSNFEYTSIDEEICGLKWNGNIEFCQKVIEKHGFDKQYCVRCHPNSANDPNWPVLFSDLDEALNRLFVKVDIILPTEKIDSHQLINAASLVVTDFSSIALDAIIMNANVEICGNTDIRKVKQDPFFNDLLEQGLAFSRIEPHALAHNFFVFRFPIHFKIMNYILFHAHRVVEKANMFFAK